MDLYNHRSVACVAGYLVLCVCCTQHGGLKKNLKKLLTMGRDMITYYLDRYDLTALRLAIIIDYDLDQTR